jgi:hypothetical protein
MVSLMTCTFYHCGKQGGKVHEFPYSFFFSLPFGLFFWLLAIRERWKIRKGKEGFLDLTVLFVAS